MPNITIAATADNLNAYQKQYARNIEQVMRVGMETEAILTPRVTEHTFIQPNSVVSADLVQAYQGGFTPRGTAAFGEVANTLQRMKVDILLEAVDIDVFFDSWMSEWVEDGRSRTEWSFPRFLYETIFLPKIVEEMELKIAWKGDYLAPTTGTPGLTINACDGLGTKIADAITDTLIPAGNLIETGALEAATMVSQLEAFCDAIPLPYRDMSGEILMSKTNATKYWRDYRSDFGVGNSVLNPNDELRVDRTGKTIRGLASMEGTDTIVFSPKGNLLVGYRRGAPRMPVIRWQEFERSLKGLAEFHRFFGVGHWEHVFVNTITP